MKLVASCDTAFIDFSLGVESQDTLIDPDKKNTFDMDYILHNHLNVFHDGRGMLLMFDYMVKGRSGSMQLMTKCRGNVFVELLYGNFLALSSKE